MSIRILQNGYVLNFEAEASQLPAETGADYIAFNHYLLSDPFARHTVREEFQKRRAAIASPIEIGTFEPNESAPVSHNRMVIKPHGSFKVYIPGDEPYAVSIADMVARDLLKLYGSKGFQDAQLLFASRHTIVATHTAQIETAELWHPHNDGKHPCDVFYLFQTALPTEIKLGNKIVTPREGTTTRLGGEILHRSQINNGPPVERKFGAIFVERKEHLAPRQLAINPVLENGNHGLWLTFERAAQEILSGPRRSQPFAVPISVADYPEHAAD